MWYKGYQGLHAHVLSRVKIPSKIFCIYYYLIVVVHFQEKLKTNPDILTSTRSSWFGLLGESLAEWWNPTLDTATAMAKVPGQL